MVSCNEKVTKLHLQAFGLSDYVVKQLFKGLDIVSTNGKLNEYSICDVKNSVQRRLANPRIHVENQAKLQRVLVWLNGESNVIQVDFSKGLTLDKKIEVLFTRIQELEDQERSIAQETEKLLEEARQMVATK